MAWRIGGEAMAAYRNGVNMARHGSSGNEIMA